VFTTVNQSLLSIVVVSSNTVDLKILHKTKFKSAWLKAKQNHKLLNIKPIIETKAILTLFLLINYNPKLIRVFFKYYFIYVHFLSC